MARLPPSCWTISWLPLADTPNPDFSGSPALENGGWRTTERGVGGRLSQRTGSMKDMADHSNMTQW